MPLDALNLKCQVFTLLTCFFQTIAAIVDHLPSLHVSHYYMEHLQFTFIATVKVSIQNTFYNFLQHFKVL